LKVYVASSWRNSKQEIVVNGLRVAGFDVYDFKNPGDGDRGFHWSDIDPKWQEWTNQEYRENLKHPIAEAGFNKDFTAMTEADACVLVLPCGRSAHTEAGWMQGRNKPVVVLLDRAEPELMYKLYSKVALDIPEVISYLRRSPVERFLDDVLDSAYVKTLMVISKRENIKNVLLSKYSSYSDDNEVRGWVLSDLSKVLAVGPASMRMIDLALRKAYIK
jgi:hypothetical protein